MEMSRRMCRKKSLQRRDVWVLFCLSLAVRLFVAALVSRPGYMDTAYYAAGAVRLARGGDLSDPFLWNYLGDPLGLPHPGFLYWMPLPSLLAAPFAALFPGSFFALQIPFIILSALLPLVTFGLAWETTGRRLTAWLAGLLSLFSGFFFPYWTLPETFAPFALFGSLVLWLSARRGTGVGGSLGRGALSASCLLPLISGGLVGLAHLTRADGILLLPVVALAVFVSVPSRRACSGASVSICHLLICHLSFLVLGYLLVMAPWFARNLAVIGTPLSPAGTKTLWLRNYDDLFCYGCDLSLRSYLEWGWLNILRSKLWAMGVNGARFLAEDCLVFLLPFVLVGLIRLRRHSSFALATIYLILIYLAHSLAFTFPGPRGGFFHASTPALPFLFVAGVKGLETAVSWTARRRCWDLHQAQAVFAVAVGVGALALSAYAAVQKLPVWQQADEPYLEIGDWLAQQGVKEETVMVGNPPAFWYHTGHSALVVPNGGVATLLAVADRYGAAYLVIDPNRPEPLAELDEDMEIMGLAPVATFDGGRVQLYRLAGTP